MDKKVNRQPDTVVFEMILLEFFERWRHHTKQHLDWAELACINWRDDFCSYVWKSLEKFEDSGMLREPLRPH